MKPAHEEALEALERLLSRKLIEQGHIKRFCFEISLIFRQYLQSRFGIPAVDLTTEEIIPRVEDDGIVEQDLRQIVREFLRETDIVKFAEYEPSRVEIEEIVRNTRTFILRTRVEPISEAERAEGGEQR
jgi:hypothetical protein